MAKQQQTLDKGPNRKQQATRKRDESAQRIIIYIAIGVGVVLLSVLGYGIVSELIVKAGAPVARIDGDSITSRDYQQRVRFERLNTRSQILQYDSYLAQIDTTDETMQMFVSQLQQQRQQLQAQLEPGVAVLFGSSVLDQMIDEQLVRAEAAKLGLTVTKDEVERQLEQLFGYDRDAVVDTTDTVTNTTPPMTMEEYQTYYEQFKGSFLRPSGFSEAAFRDSVEVDLLRPKVVEALTQDIETTALQANVTVLVTGTVEAAAAWQQRLNAGEAIDTLVEEVNGAESSTGWALDLSWLTPGRLTSEYGAEAEAAAFEIPVGTASEPIPGTSDRFYVIFVRGREVRELDASVLSAARDQKFSGWLSEQKAARVEYFDYEKVTPDTP